MLGETVALETARSVAAHRPAVVLPMLWTGLSEHHMSFGGTVTLDAGTFLAVLRCICQSGTASGASCY
jgi:creatinine amidohydrolase